MKYLSVLHKSIFIITFSCVFFGCLEKPKKIDYKKIEINYSANKVNFCDWHNFEWDSILIVRPYMRVDAWQGLKIKNLNSLEDKLKIMESIDWMHYLIFINRNIAIAYSDIPRNYFDFVFENDTIIQQFIYKENCVLNISSNQLNLVLEVPLKR